MQGPASVEARIEPHEASRPGKEALATWVGALFAFSTFVLAAVACLGSSVLVIRVLSSPEHWTGSTRRTQRSRPPLLLPPCCC